MVGVAIELTRDCVLIPKEKKNKNKENQRRLGRCQGNAGSVRDTQFSFFFFFFHPVFSFQVYLPPLLLLLLMCLLFPLQLFFFDKKLTKQRFQFIKDVFF